MASLTTISLSYSLAWKSPPQCHIVIFNEQFQQLMSHLFPLTRFVRDQHKLFVININLYKNTQTPFKWFRSTEIQRSWRNLKIQTILWLVLPIHSHIVLVLYPLIQEKVTVVLSQYGKILQYWGL